MQRCEDPNYDVLVQLFKRPPAYQNRCPQQNPGFQDKFELDSTAHGQIRCSNCNHNITNKQHIKSVSGAHVHQCTNPHGIMFTIGCFDSAPGCASVGEQYAEWSWFREFRWQLVQCNRCLEHLGWRYLGGDSSEFFGLIVSRLVFDKTDGSV